MNVVRRASASAACGGGRAGVALNLRLHRRARRPAAAEDGAGEAAAAGECRSKIEPVVLAILALRIFPGCVRLGIDPDQRDTISGPRARPAARLTSAAVRNGTEIITKAPRDIRTNTIA